MARRISLVNRTVVVFAIAAMGIVAGAMAVPWIAAEQIGRETRRSEFREMVRAYGESGRTGGESAAAGLRRGDRHGRWRHRRSDGSLPQRERVLRDHRREGGGGKPIERSFRALRRSELAALQEGRAVDLRPPSLPTPPDDPVDGLLVLDRPMVDAAALIRAKRIWFLASAGLAAAALVAV